MYPDGRVNYSMLRQLIEYQIENGADALVLCGTTGEAPSLDDKEHLLVFAFAHEAIAGRVPLYCGHGFERYPPRPLPCHWKQSSAVQMRCCW